MGNPKLLAHKHYHDHGPEPSKGTGFRARALSSVSPRAQGNRLRPMRLGGSPVRGCVSKGAVTKLRLDLKNKRTEVLLRSLRQAWIYEYIRGRHSLID